MFVDTNNFVEIEKAMRCEQDEESGGRLKNIKEQTMWG